MVIGTFSIPARHLCAVFALAVLTGCSSGGGADGFPRIANPPAFDYASGAELRTQMHRLAFELQQLDMAMLAETSEMDATDSGTQDEIVSHLRDIERIGNELRDGDMSTSHTFLRNDMGNFLTTVSRARRAAEDNPPSYYMAGRVSGACVNCHEVRR